MPTLPSTFHRPAASSLALGLLLLAGLGCSESPAWRDLDRKNLSPEQGAQWKLAMAACQDLGKALKSRLKQAMADGGAVAAVEACRSSAPEITGQISSKPGLAIGRTSHRLRNPANAAPAWAAAHVARAEARVLLRAGPEGQLGALLPIPTGAVCVNCHGDAANTPAPLRELLARHYPQDQAFGFAPEQLRGWFWVEVK